MTKVLIPGSMLVFALTMVLSGCGEAEDTCQRASSRLSQRMSTRAQRSTWNDRRESHGDRVRS